MLRVTRGLRLFILGKLPTYFSINYDWLNNLFGAVNINRSHMNYLSQIRMKWILIWFVDTYLKISWWTLRFHLMLLMETESLFKVSNFWYLDHEFRVDECQKFKHSQNYKWITNKKIQVEKQTPRIIQLAWICSEIIWKIMLCRCRKSKRIYLCNSRLKPYPRRIRTIMM